MSFFKKLKDRLFNSSSRIDEGLSALVGEGDAAGHEGLVATPDRDAAPEMSPEVPAAMPPLTEQAGSAVEPQIDAPSDLPEAPTLPTLPTLPTPAAALASPPAGPAAPPAAAERAAAAPVVAPPVPQPAPAPAAPPAPAAARPVPASPVPVSPVPASPEPAQTGGARPGLIGRLFGRAPAAGAEAPRRVLDAEMLENLEDLLIQADMGVETALRVTANIAEGHMGRRLSVADIKGLLAAEVARIMATVARPMPLYPSRPQVVLVVGVNGSGKTTTIGKLASQFRAAGKTVVIAAGDTFRAAAVEQLQVWGDRAGVPVLTAPEGSDPASLAFDAMGRAQADGADLLLIDTAGRLQNRADLMEELAKIVRVIRKKDPSAPHNTLLVLDATTGQNALAQVDIFRKLADVSGLVMTKLDGTAKGGVLVALADRFGLPIHAIGVGEQIDDLQPFDPEEFADALVGR